MELCWATRSNLLKYVSTDIHKQSEAIAIDKVGGPDMTCTRYTGMLPGKHAMMRGESMGKQIHIVPAAVTRRRHCKIVLDSRVPYRCGRAPWTRPARRKTDPNSFVSLLYKRMQCKSITEDAHTIRILCHWRDMIRICGVTDPRSNPRPLRRPPK